MSTPSGSYRLSSDYPLELPSRSESSLPAFDLPRPVPRLWRSRSDRVLAGVLGGLAEKYGWEPRPVRILYGLLGVLSIPLLGIPAIVPYVWMWSITRALGPVPQAQPLRRSRSHKLVAGVLGGIAEKIGWNPGVVRLGYAGLTVATFGLPGIVTYLVMWAKMKQQPKDESGRDVDAAEYTDPYGEQRSY